MTAPGHNTPAFYGRSDDGTYEVTWGDFLGRGRTLSAAIQQITDMVGARPFYVRPAGMENPPMSDTAPVAHTIVIRSDDGDRIDGTVACHATKAAAACQHAFRADAGHPCALRRALERDDLALGIESIRTADGTPLDVVLQHAAGSPDAGLYRPGVYTVPVVGVNDDLGGPVVDGAVTYAAASAAA